VTSIEWLLVWTVVAIGLLIAVHGAGDGVMFILFWVQMTVLFSVGCQAYYGVGRFRPRLRFIPRARRLLDTKCDFTIGRPALPAQLERAEQLLGLHLPRSYQEFLTSFGELRAPALKILGITQRTDLEHPTLEDCVGATLVGREHYQVPQGYLVCGVDRDGNLLCLDTVAMAYQEGAVVSWRTQTRAYGDWLAMSFGAYLMRELASVPTMPIF